MVGQSQEKVVGLSVNPAGHERHLREVGFQSSWAAQETQHPLALVCWNPGGQTHPF